jgi:type IV secretory pathway protease TraF
MVMAIAEVEFLNCNRWPIYDARDTKGRAVPVFRGNAYFSHLAIYLLPSETNTLSP